MQLHYHRNFQKTHYPEISVQSPGSNRAERPAYGGFSNAIVCVSYRQHPIMAEEERGQERGMSDGALQKQCSRSSRRSRGITDLGENLRGEGKAPLERLPLSPWVVSLTHSSNVIKWNSEPEKCYPTKSTIGSLLSYKENYRQPAININSKNTILEAQQITNFCHNHQ